MNQEANAAKDWFDRRSIDSTWINVVVVAGVKDPLPPQPSKSKRLEDTTQTHDRHHDYMYTKRTRIVR
jgi:hypothetical protein